MAGQDSPYDLLPDSPNPKKIAPPSPVAPPAQSRLKPLPQRTCPYCGFSFLGPPKARCPECSASLESGTTDLLKFADARWVRTVSLGLTLISLAVTGHIAGAALRYLDFTLAAIVHAGTALLLAVGVLLATRKEPPALSSAATSDASPAPLIARIAAIVSLLLWAVICILVLRHNGARTIKPLVLLVLTTHGLLAVALGFRANGLAYRLPDDTLASHSLHTGWLAAAVCGLCFGVHLLELTTRVHLAFFFCSFPLIAGVLVMLTWGMITLIRLAATMRTSAKEGQAIAARRRANV